MARPDRRLPDRDVSGRPIAAEADGDQHHAGDREERVEALVWPLAEPRDERGPRLARHREGVGAEEEHQAEDEKRHRVRSPKCAVNLSGR